MPKTMKARSSPKPPVRSKSRGDDDDVNRQGSSRQGKKRVLARIQLETSQINAGSFLTTLRRQGYEELPLEEIQDRLSKLRTALAEFIVTRRG
jgi:hypothetical protein